MSNLGERRINTKVTFPYKATHIVMQQVVQIHVLSVKISKASLIINYSSQLFVVMLMVVGGENRKQKKGTKICPLISISLLKD